MKLDLKQKTVILAGCGCLVVGLVLGLILGNLFFSGSSPQSNQPSGKTVIKVNGTKISLEIVKDYLSQRLRVSTLSKDKIDDVINELITAELVYQQARSQNLEQDPKFWLTVRQVYAERVLQNQVENSLKSNPITDQEVKTYYDTNKSQFNRDTQVRLADIFIKAEKTDSASQMNEKRNKAEKALKEALSIEGRRAGFGMLIRTYSDKHPSYLLGSTDYFDPNGQPVGIEKEIATAAFKLKRMGEVYPEIIKTDLGYHVIMLAGKRPPIQQEFNDIERQIRKKVESERRKSVRESYVATLKAKASIDKDNGLAEELLADLNKQLSDPKAFSPESD